MASNFGNRDEVKDDSQDMLVFDITYSPRTLGKDYRVIGLVLPLDKAEIVPVPKTIEVELKPRYKALIAVCLCAGLAGAGAIALIANSTNSSGETIAYSAKRKGTPRPPGSY